MNKDIFKEKKDKILLEKLTSVNEKNILEAINNLREKGSVVFLPVLIDLYMRTEFEEVKIQVGNLLSEIKNSKAAPYFIDAILNINYKVIKKDLLNFCWQIGFDFQEYLDVFVKIFVLDDFETAFEAFTIIDCMEYKMKSEIIEQQIKFLNLNSEKISLQKKELSLELIKILNNLSENE